MSHVLRVGVADQIAFFRAYNTDGSGKTDLTSATTGLALTVFRVGAAEVAIASLSNKAADNTTHADGAIRAVGGNLYTVDLPDAATADQVPSVGVRGSYTGGVIEPVPHPVVAYNPASVAVGANTVTPPTVAEFEARTLPAADYFVVGDYTAPANSDIGLIKVITDRLGAMLVLDGSVYQYTANALELAPAGGGGSDPLESAVPGAYAAGTAGYVIGTFVDSKLSTIQQGVNAIGNASPGEPF